MPGPMICNKDALKVAEHFEKGRLCIKICVQLFLLGFQFDKLPPNVFLGTAARLFVVLVTITLVGANTANFASCPWSPAWIKVAPFVLGLLWPDSGIVSNGKLTYYRQLAQANGTHALVEYVAQPEGWKSPAPVPEK